MCLVGRIFTELPLTVLFPKSTQLFPGFPEKLDQTFSVNNPSSLSDSSENPSLAQFLDPLPSLGELIYLCTSLNLRIE